MSAVVGEGCLQERLACGGEVTRIFIPTVTAIAAGGARVAGAASRV